MPSRVADNSGKHMDLIGFCKGVSKRAKKFKGKSAEAADVARRFFRVANRRLNGSNSNDRVITDIVFGVLEAGMDALSATTDHGFCNLHHVRTRRRAVITCSFHEHNRTFQLRMPSTKHELLTLL